MKRIMYTIGGLAIIITLIACDADSSSETTKYLAKNVLLDSISANKAYAQTHAVDTTTQILAENVIYEESIDSQIESDNVQDALEEISLLLSEVLPGTWDIQNYVDDYMHDDTGQIIIYDDGTFDLITGSFGAIGMGSKDPSTYLCGHVEGNQTYEFFSEEIVMFSHLDPTTNPPHVKRSVLPRLVKLREDEITFIGGQGCGSVRERVSILTRVR